MGSMLWYLADQFQEGSLDFIVLTLLGVEYSFELKFMVGIAFQIFVLITLFLYTIPLWEMEAWLLRYKYINLYQRPQGCHG